ncbi:MAG: SMC family ATPase [Nanoarchaeota archaeon]
MLLKQLKIRNIRSYVDGEISFLQGSTLLSGDIGSGKSTILLSIEFALFGASRPDLPAEALLRKGSTQGSVELTFLLNDLGLNGGLREITIKRSIKKEKDSVKQLPGYLIINNIKKELTPQELKAEVISLLGYPEEFAGKNKNYIYRYTVYTPQEEMKLILQEDEKLRLDVLRKIFSVDKYETIRENLQVFLKEMRADIALLKAKTEPLEEQKKRLEQLTAEKNELFATISSLLPLLASTQQKLELQKKEIVQLELKQKEYLQLKYNYSKLQALAGEKKKQLQQYLSRLEQLSREISALPLAVGNAEGSLEEAKLEEAKAKLQAKLQETEHKKNNIILRRATLRQNVQHLQQLIQRQEEEINIILRQTSVIDEKRKSKGALQREIVGKGELLQTKIKLDDSLEELSVFIARKSILLSQSKSLLERVISLKNCPTCLQEVSEEHKQRIYNDESGKIAEIEPVLQELEKRKEEVAVQKEICLKAIDGINLKENILAGISLELLQLEEKQKHLEEKQGQLKSWMEEAGRQTKHLAELEAEDLGKMDLEILETRDLLNMFVRKEFLERNKLDLTLLIGENRKQAGNFEQEIAAINRKIMESKDFTGEIDSNKEGYDKAVLEEKELAVKIAKLQTEAENLKKQEEQMVKVIDALNTGKNKLVRLTEINHWLEEYFTKLTLTIEKQVMTNIYYHFNQLFQEWFLILIDDENVCSRIDETFTPVIEQNGYEISFFNLSGGEKTSAALAYRLALNKVINDVVSGIGTKEILILDEPTDGFSSEQLDKIREILEKLNLRQVIIVSHESKIESFVDNVMKVNKEGQVSFVVS